MIGLQDPPTSGITSGPCCAMAMATDVNDWQRCSWARRRESRATAQSGRQELFCRVAGAVAPGGRSWCAWRHCRVQWTRQRSEPLCLAVGADATDGWTHCAMRQEPMRWAAGAAAAGGRSPRQEAGAAAPHGRSWAAGAALGAWRQEQQGDRSRCAGRQEPLLLAAGPLRCAAGHCCGGTGAAARGGRSRCLQQEPLRPEARDGRAGAAVLGGRRHCAGRQEPLRSRCGVRRRFTVRQPRRVDVQQETRLWVTAGGPRWRRAQGVAHEEASCWGSSL